MSLAGNPGFFFIGKLSILDSIRYYVYIVNMKDKGTCITAAMKKDREFEKEIDYHRYWKDMYEQEHKLRQEAEGEMTIVKGIGQNSPEMKSLRARVKDLEEINESHQRYNGKLQERLKEVEMDNKKMALQIEDKINQMRRSGM